MQMAKRIRAKLVLELLARGMTGREIRSTRHVECHPLSFTGGNHAASDCAACASSNSSGLM